MRRQGVLWGRRRRSAKRAGPHRHVRVAKTRGRRLCCARVRPARFRLTVRFSRNCSLLKDGPNRRASAVGAAGEAHRERRPSGADRRRPAVGVGRLLAIAFHHAAAVAVERAAQDAPLDDEGAQLRRAPPRSGAPLGRPRRSGWARRAGRTPSAPRPGPAGGETGRDQEDHAHERGRAGDGRARSRNVQGRSAPVQMRRAEFGVEMGKQAGAREMRARDLYLRGSLPDDARTEVSYLHHEVFTLEIQQQVESG